MNELIPVDISHARILYEWAIDSVTRLNSVNENDIDFRDHLIWLKDKINSKSAYHYILMIDDSFSGQIRFDYLKDYYIISFSIDANYRGKGLGKEIVEMGISKIRNLDCQAQFKALVLPANKASNHIFEKLKFKKDTEIVLNSKTFNQYTLD